MKKEVLILYTMLSQEDWDKVDAHIVRFSQRGPIHPGLGASPRFWNRKADSRAG